MRLALLLLLAALVLGSAACTVMNGSGHLAAGRKTWSM
jgi:hypothetical protein